MRVEWFTGHKVGHCVQERQKSSREQKMFSDSHVRRRFVRNLFSFCLINCTILCQPLPFGIYMCVNVNERLYDVGTMFVFLKPC